MCPVQVSILATIGIQGAVIVHDVDHLQLVPLANLVVVGVMGRGDLQGTRAKLSVHILIGYDVDPPAS